MPDEIGEKPAGDQEITFWLFLITQNSPKNSTHSFLFSGAPQGPFTAPATFGMAGNPATG